MTGYVQVMRSRLLHLIEFQSRKKRKSKHDGPSIHHTESSTRKGMHKASPKLLLITGSSLGDSQEGDSFHEKPSKILNASSTDHEESSTPSQRKK